MVGTNPFFRRFLYKKMKKKSVKQLPKPFSGNFSRKKIRHKQLPGDAARVRCSHASYFTWFPLALAVPSTQCLSTNKMRPTT